MKISKIKKLPIIYCCRDINKNMRCKGEISSFSALYGGGRCQVCAEIEKSKNPKIKEKRRKTIALKNKNKVVITYCCTGIDSNPNCKKIISPATALVGSGLCHSCANINRYKNPEERKKTGKSSKIYHNQPHVKKKYIKFMEEWFSKPENKKKHHESMKQPEVIKKKCTIRRKDCGWMKNIEKIK